MRAIASAKRSAITSISAASRFIIGCGRNTSGSFGSFNASRRRYDRVRNGGVTKVAVGTPADSMQNESWTLHDEQDPQSPVDASTRSGFHAMIKGMISAPVPPAWRLRQTLVSATP